MQSTMLGYFKGCLSDSKWGKIREKFQWTAICSNAPRIAKKMKEVPNTLRQVLGLSAVKGPHIRIATKMLVSIPPELESVVEEMVVERINLGEEVQMVFVKNAILLCTDLWNKAVRQARSEIPEKKVEILRRLNSGLSEEDTERDVEAKAESALKVLEASLQEIDVKPNDACVMPLDWTDVCV